MERTTADRRWPAFWLIVQAIGLCAVYWVYVVVRVGPELFYHQHPHVFLLDGSFFRGMMDHPGGPADYLAAFLSPLLAWDWLGATVVTLLVATVCWATRGVVTAVSGSGGEIAYLVPAVLVLMVMGQYVHPVPLCVGLGLALVGANLYFRLGGYAVGMRFSC
ncbi:MAG: DUF6057 family protein [Thermoguttaceae bacterium]